MVKRKKRPLQCKCWFSEAEKRKHVDACFLLTFFSSLIPQSSENCNYPLNSRGMLLQKLNLIWRDTGFRRVKSIYYFHYKISLTAIVPWWGITISQHLLQKISFLVRNIQRVWGWTHLSRVNTFPLEEHPILLRFLMVNLCSRRYTQGIQSGFYWTVNAFVVR